MEPSPSSWVAALRTRLSPTRSPRPAAAAAAAADAEAAGTASIVDADARAVSSESPSSPLTQQQRRGRKLPLKVCLCLNLRSAALFIAAVSIFFGFYVATRDINFSSVAGIVMTVGGLLLIIAHSLGTYAIVKNNSPGIVTYAVFFAIAALVEIAAFIRVSMLDLNPDVQQQGVQSCFENNFDYFSTNATRQAQYNATLLSFCQNRVPMLYTVYAIEDIVAVLLAIWFTVAMVTFAIDFRKNPAKYTEYSTPTVMGMFTRGAGYYQQRPASAASRVAPLPTYEPEVPPYNPLKEGEGITQPSTALSRPSEIAAVERGGQ
ncbi:hypothetical protein HK405_000767 [Cladochytrium tenue]|nr:hypothetical protein HK405_000767 [Cladochytrium tenue]